MLLPSALALVCVLLGFTMVWQYALDPNRACDKFAAPFRDTRLSVPVQPILGLRDTKPPSAADHVRSQSPAATPTLHE